MSWAIYRERIVRDSDAQIEARRRRQREVAAVRAAKQMAKVATAIERRVEAEEPPQERVSEVLNIFRREYEALTGREQLQFEAVVKRYVLGLVAVDEWVRVIRSLKASYWATLPPGPPPGGRRTRAKDRWVPPPQGW